LHVPQDEEPLCTEYDEDGCKSEEDVDMAEAEAEEGLCR